MQGKLLKANNIDLVTYWNNINFTVAKTSGIAQVTEITCLPAISMQTNSYLFINSPDYSYYVWFNIDGVTYNINDPKIYDKYSIKVDILENDNAIQIASKLSLAINKVGDFTSINSNDKVIITCNIKDSVSIKDEDVSTNFIVNTVTLGKSPILYEGMLWPDVIDILDVNISDDGGAEFLVKYNKVIKYNGSGRPSIAAAQRTSFHIEKRIKPSGWLLLS